MIEEYEVNHVIQFHKVWSAINMMPEEDQLRLMRALELDPGMSCSNRDVVDAVTQRIMR